MKDSVKKVKLNRKDLERLEQDYDLPQREKIRRRKRKHEDSEAPKLRDRDGKKHRKS